MALSFVSLFCLTGGARSQTSDPDTAIAAGDAAVSGFSGVILATPDLPPGTDPLDRTIIDPKGASLKIFDLSELDGPLDGQTIDAPANLEVTADKIGQVFGLAFDDGGDGEAPNLYAGATSAYGIYLVGPKPGEDGAPERLKKGAPGARFMEGLFGGLRGASPGSIYKIDGTTGEVALFADTSSGGAPNSGPGLGDLAFDPQSRNLYASDLDTGLIHRFDLNGAHLGSFDHGAKGRAAANLPSVADDGRRMEIESPGFDPQDVSTWGLTQPERRINGLAVRDRRLYYAVLEGPEVWSVSLNPDGSFGSDPRKELSVRAEAGQAITDIAFDAQGRMTLATRGPALSPSDYGKLTGAGGQVLRFIPEMPDNPATPDRWQSAAETLAAGIAGASGEASGGVSLQYRYGPDGSLDYSACDGTLLATGDRLGRGQSVSGIQLSAGSQRETAFVPYEEARSDPEQRGHVGDVEAVQQCEAERADGAEGYPPVVETEQPAEEAPDAGADAFPPVVTDPETPPVVTTPAPGAPPADGFPPVVEDEFPPVEDEFPPVEDDVPPDDAPPGEEDQEQPGEEDETPPQTGPLNIAKKALNANCNAATGQGCDFEITITNVGDTPFNGVIEFDESVTGDDAFFGATEIKNGPTPPWKCTKAGQQFNCSAQVALAPKASTTILIGFGLGGGIGNVKELKNCATLKGTQNRACATIANQGAGAPPPGQPGQLNQLKIEKHALVQSCTGLGGGCDFEISITNPGPGDVQGPIEIEDSVTAGGKIIETTQLTGVPDLPWNCLHQNQGRFTCTHPGPLKANETLKFTLKTTLNAKTDARHIRNCAAIKGTNNQDCTEIILSKLEIPKLRAEKLVRGDCSKSCEILITIRNTGEETYKGSIFVSDIPFDTNRKRVDLPITILSGPAAPFECRKFGDAFIQCERKNAELPPGGITVLRFTVRFETSRFDGFNCAHVGAQHDDDFVDNEHEQRCARVSFAPAVIDKLKVPPPLLVVQPQLKIEKQAPNADAPGGQGHCSFEGMCRFTIIVTNVGTADFKGELAISDNVKGGQPDDIAEGPGSPKQLPCRKDGNTGFACNSPGMISIPKGASIRVEVAVTPGKSWQNPDTNLLTNCAIATWRPADDQGNLQQEKTTGEACASVKLDPFAVSVRKSGDQSCQPGGLCRFDLDIFNPGPIPHDDPVTVTDSLSGIGAAEIVGITGDLPFPCSPQPTQIPFSCTSAGNFPLKVGESKRYTLTVRMPESADGSGFVNCASVSAPGEAAPRATPLRATGGAPGSGAGGKEGSCHSVKLEPKDREPEPKPSADEPAPPAGRPLPPREAACAGGMILTRGGRCACPAGTVWSGRRCVPQKKSPPPPPSSGAGHDTSKSPTTETRPDCPRGTRYIDGACRKPDQRQDCPRGMTGTPPYCCPAGTRFENGVCRKPAPPQERRCPRGMTGTPPYCCPAGTRYENGVCRKPTPPQERRCPRGMVGTPPNCACPPGTRFINGYCRRPAAEPKTCPQGMTGTPPNCCPPGTRFVNGVCRRLPAKPKTCPQGMTGTPPNCCPPGTRYENGACRKPAPPAERRCPRGMVGTPPNCACPPGTAFSRGRCRRVSCPQGMTGTPPNCCPPGTRYENGACRKPAPPAERKCPRGMVGTPPNCACPPGTRYLPHRRRCIRIPAQPTTPQQSCSRGMIGTPPNCTCPPGTRYSRHLRRCLRVAPSAPDKSGPIVK